MNRKRKHVNGGTVGEGVEGNVGARIRILMFGKRKAARGSGGVWEWGGEGKGEKNEGKQNGRGKMQLSGPGCTTTERDKYIAGGN